MPSNVRRIGLDTAGLVAAELIDGGVRCTKTLRQRVATRGFRERAVALAQSFGGWSIAPLEGGTSGELVFEYPDAWEPLLIWLERCRAEPFFPLERALEIVVDLCSGLQRGSGAEVEPELHAAAVVVSDLRLPHCRFTLWPRDTLAQPADYVECTPEVLLCMPPEHFCGVPLPEGRAYAAAALLRMIFMSAAPGMTSSDLIEWLVIEGNGGPLAPPPSLPRGVLNALREEWETLSSLVLRASARRSKVRDVSIDQLMDACLSILRRLDYWKLVDQLAHSRSYEDAQQVCEYAIWAKGQDDFLRPALKRRLGELYLNQLHKYEQAAAVFEDYIAHERGQDVRVVGHIRELYGDALAAQGRHELALAAYSQAATESEDPNLYLKIASVHRSGGNPDAALESLKRLIEGDRNQIEALEMVAEILLETGEPAEAQRYVSQALNAIRDKKKHGVMVGRSAAIETAAMHALAAEALFEQAKYDDALALAAEALRADQRSYRAHNVFGRHYVLSGKIVPAMRSFVSSLRIRPDQPEIERWLATAVMQGSSAKRVLRKR